MERNNSSAQLQEPLLDAAQETTDSTEGFRDDTGQDPGVGPLQGSGEKGVDLVKNGANEEADLYRMKELIREQPDDVLHFLAGSGVVKLGEMELPDSLVLGALDKDELLTCGADHLECDWQRMWLDVLTDRGRKEAAGWATNVTLEAHAVTLRDAAAEGARGLLQPLLKRYQARACTAAVFGLPAVQAIISFKWNTWAKRFLWYELFVYLIWLLSFVAFTLLFEREEPDAPLSDLLTTPEGAATVAMSLVSLTAMVPFLYMEVCTISAYQLGWFNLWNTIDVSVYVLQIVISYTHLTRQYVEAPWFVVLLSVQHLLLWSKLHYFARVLSPSKNLLVDTIRIVIDDMTWFLVFLGLTMLGFAFAFYSLFRQDRDTDYADFTNFWHALASMLSYLLAMFDYNVFYNSTNPVAAMVMFIMFEFVCNVMLLNIMIAIMTSSFNKVTQDEGPRFNLSKAAVIDELEATLPRWLKRNSWYPPFVHIIKVHPASAYEMNLSRVWSGMGLMESNVLNASQQARGHIEAAGDKIARAAAKLDVVAEMMVGLMQQHQQQQQQQQEQQHQGQQQMPLEPLRTTGTGPELQEQGEGAIHEARSKGELRTDVGAVADVASQSSSRQGSVECLSGQDQSQHHDDHTSQ